MVSLSRRDVEALRRNGSLEVRTTPVVDTRAPVAPSRIDRYQAEQPANGCCARTLPNVLLSELMLECPDSLGSAAGVALAVAAASLSMTQVAHAALPSPIVPDAKLDLGMAAPGAAGSGHFRPVDEFSVDAVLGSARVRAHADGDTSTQEKR